MRALRILIGVGYPFVVFAALSVFRARTVAIILAAALAARTLTGRRRFEAQSLARVLPLVGLVGGVLLLAVIFNEGRFFFFVPVLVNIALLISFGRTLRSGPSMAETLARLQGYRLSDEKIRYCQMVTALWCVFFVLNSGVILWLALYASLAWWTAYTGLIAYICAGLLLAAELVYRAWRFRDYQDGIVDAALRRMFPPRRVAE